MAHRTPGIKLAAALLALPALLCLAARGAAGAAETPVAKQRYTVFEVCHHGCRYSTINAAVDAAGAYAYRNRKAKVKVAVEPGAYREEVVITAIRRRRRFDGLTIEGTRPNRKRVVLDGVGTRGDAVGPAQYGIFAEGVDGLVLRNMWARGYGTAGFFVEGAGAVGPPCNGYTMENLQASGNSSYGLEASNCVGGKMLDSVAYRQGAAGFAVAETPCDDPFWNPLGTEICQATPRWTQVAGNASYENAVGYLGSDSKYVRIVENALYDDGTGLVVASTVGGRQPNGWNMIERNDAFWNNYDSFLAGSPFANATPGMGELNGHRLNFPIGVGIVLYGGYGDIVRGNRVFGNYKWGVASFSGPGESLIVDETNEAKNVNNEIVENMFGRAGADPNGEFDLFNDASGGGNCWGANSPGSTFAPGNGKVGTAAIYPVCPQPKVAYGSVHSLNSEAGLQVAAIPAATAKTVLGYAALEPPQNMQCSWTKRVSTHPAFQRFEPSEVPARGGEISC